MTQHNSSDSDRDERTNRFRAINSAKQEEEALPPRFASTPDLKAGARSPASSTPKGDPAEAAPTAAEALMRLRQTQKMKVESPPPSEVEATQKGRLDFKAFTAQRKAQAPESPSTVKLAGEAEPATPSRKMRFAPAYWTIASTLSLIVNLILIVVVLFLLGYVSKLNIQITELLEYAKLPEDTVKGLYENFVLMDDAHIRTQIPVSLEVPVQFDIAINTQTEVTLSQDTPINQARVTLSTGGLNISNAPANIILPAGTRLPINLSLIVPVDKRVPVSLVVPVDIALKDTDLHAPFVGLQQVVQPLYCLLNPQATSNAGILLCQPAP